MLQLKLRLNINYLHQQQKTWSFKLRKRKKQKTAMKCNILVQKYCQKSSNDNATKHTKQLNVTIKEITKHEW